MLNDTWCIVTSVTPTRRQKDFAVSGYRSPCMDPGLDALDALIRALIWADRSSVSGFTVPFTPSPNVVDGYTRVYVEHMQQIRRFDRSVVDHAPRRADAPPRLNNMDDANSAETVGDTDERK